MEKEAEEQADKSDYIERVLVKPVQEDWLEDEKRLAEQALAKHEQLMKAEKGVYGGLEDEPPDQDAVMFAAGVS